MNPETHYVPLRNTTKTSADRIAMKLELLAERWNTGNDYPAYEAKIVDVSKVVK
jgi:hypothetical protein